MLPQSFLILTLLFTVMTYYSIPTILVMTVMVIFVSNVTANVIMATGRIFDLSRATLSMIRWISDRNWNQNKQAYYIKLSYFYDIKIAKLYAISLLICVSISIGNPPIRSNDWPLRSSYELIGVQQAQTRLLRPAVLDLKCYRYRRASRLERFENRYYITNSSASLG